MVKQKGGALNPKALNMILIISGVLVFLYVIALIVSSLTKSTTYPWPPWKSHCPDYWSTSKDSNGNIICTKSLENPNGLNQRCSPLVENGSYIGNGPNMVNLSGLSMSEKCNWAKNCNILWENVDNQC
jgi:hypothetical protein